MSSTREIPPSAGPTAARTVALDTADPHQAMSVGGDVYHPHRIRMDSRARHFRMGLKAVHVPDLTVGLLEYGQHVQVRTPPLQDSYQVNFTAFGSVTMGYGPQSVPVSTGQAAVHGFTEETRMEGWSRPARIIGLKVTRAALERELELLTGAPCEAPLTFQGDFDLESPGGRAWRSAVQALAQGLAYPDPVAVHPQVAGPLTQAVTRGLLLAAPHNHSHLLAGAEQLPAPATVTAAMDYLRANARRRPGVAEVALAAGTSVRTLQAEFRRHLDTTPVQALRRIRLEGARQELAAGHPGATVAAVARRWGFNHPGRFAVHFAQAFGEPPSQHLARPA